MKRAISLLTAALLAIAIAAPAAQGQTTPAGYADQANAICKDATRQGERALKKVKPTGDRRRDALRRGGVFAKLLGKLANGLAEVEPAPVDEALADSWVAGIRRQKRLTERYLRSARKGNHSRALVFAKKAGKVAGKNVAKAKQLGATACAGG